MPRKEKRDPFWDYVEIIIWERDRKKWRCKYCSQEFTANVKRVKAHLGKVSDENIQNCQSDTVPKDIMLEAEAAYKDASRTYKRQRMKRTSGGPPMISCVQGQPRGPTPPGGSATQLEIGGTSSASLQHIRNLTGSNVNPTGVIGESSCITHRSARKREELDQVIYETEERLKKLKAIKNEFGKTGQGGNDSWQLETHGDELTNAVDELLIQRGMHSESLIPEQGPEGGAFLLTDPVGEDFEEHMDDICEDLFGSDISQIGIYGMAGVGKTFLAKHLYNKLYDHGSFENVVWVSVSKGDTVGDLHWKIARAVEAGDIFECEDEISVRAEKLRKHLTKMGRSLLILDDIWEEFAVEDVGIPIQSDGMRLILTTRSLSICRNICQHEIEIKCLSERGEAFSLFLTHLGRDSLPPKEKQIAEQILLEYGGLPLAIVEAAKSIREMFLEHKCPSNLQELSHLINRRNRRNLVDVVLQETDKRIFALLKVGFDEMTFQMQESFLRCALYRSAMPRSYLIDLFIDDKLIARSTSRAKMLEKGNAILDRLIDACLLERHYDEHHVVMLAVIKRMGLNIMGTKGMLVVKDPCEIMHWPTGLRLARISDDDYEYDYDKGDGVGIEDRNGVVAGECDKWEKQCELSTLLMDDNCELTKIPGISFFKYLTGLKVLNLSRSGIKELPDYISGLLSLEVLVLRRCKELSSVPSLVNLKLLTKLDLLECTALKALTGGSEHLLHLKYLDLGGTWIVVNEIEGSDISLTGPLEVDYLRCHFYDEEQFHTYMSYCMPSQYDLTLGYSILPLQVYYDESFGRRITISEDEIGEICLPKDVEKLVLYGSNTCSLELLDCFPEEDINLSTGMVMEEKDVVGLYVKSPPHNQSYHDLKELQFSFCSRLKYLFSASATCYLRNLQTVEAICCDELEGITVAGSELPDGAFPSLEHISVEGCGKMRTLVGHFLLPHLQKKLRRITVQNCSGMEEIIESDHLMSADGQSGQSSGSGLSLPQLQLDDLYMWELPELKGIYNQTINCKSITVWNCPKLTRIPLYPPPPSLESIYVLPKEKWESFEWQEDEAKAALKPFLRHDPASSYFHLLLLVESVYWHSDAIGFSLLCIPPLFWPYII